jgi:hypothetical protein
MDFQACFERYTDCCLVIAEVSDRLPISKWATKKINVKVLLSRSKMMWKVKSYFGFGYLPLDSQSCVSRNIVMTNHPFSVYHFLELFNTFLFSHSCHSSLYSETCIHHSCLLCFFTVTLCIFWSWKSHIWIACHYIRSIIHQSVIFPCHLFKISTPDTQYA